MLPYIIAVDFDGTLCESNWPDLGIPNLELIRYLKDERHRGTRLILWTCRTGDRLEVAVNWCQQHGLQFDAVNENLPEVISYFGRDSRKIFAHEYIDDYARKPFWEGGSL